MLTLLALKNTNSEVYNHCYLLTLLPVLLNFHFVHCALRVAFSTSGLKLDFYIAALVPSACSLVFNI